MVATPPHWDAGSDLLLPVGRGPSLLLLDYDGTLAPFHEDRMRALPWPGVVERLDQLSMLPAVRCAVVSGRSARELAALIPTRHPIEIWGSHGREHLSAIGVYTLSRLMPDQQAALDRLDATLRDAGISVLIERKPASIAAHWRGLESAGIARVGEVVREAWESFGQPVGLQLLAFDGGIEIRSEAVNKGTAVLQMLAQFPDAAAAAYLGDDVTDEDAFAALAGRGITMLVRPEPRPSHASCWLRPPEELLAFLDAWIHAAQEATEKASDEAAG